MKIPGALLISGVFLFILSMNLPISSGQASGWMFRVVVVCLAVGTIWGLVRGPDAVRLAAALATTSLAVFIIAMMGVEPTIGGPGPKPLLYVPDMNAGIAGVAALFLALAVVQGFRAYRAEATPRGTDE